jgi:hypothetical protein
MGACNKQHDRRTFLRGVGPPLLGLGLAGCTTPGGGDENDGGDSENGEGDEGEAGEEEEGEDEGENENLRRPA